MTTPTYSVAIAFSVNSWTDVTADILALSIDRQIANLFNPLSPAQLVLEAENSTGDFSPQNSGSRFGNGALIPNLPIRVQATHTGSLRTLFTGKLDRIDLQTPRSSGRTASLYARDSVKGLTTRTITTSAFVGSPISSIFATVLGQTAVSSFAIDSSITDVSPFAWFNDRDAVGVISELLASGFYNGYVDTADTFRVQPRYWDIGASIVASYSNDGFNLTHSTHDDAIFNRVIISGSPRKRATNVATVAWIGQPITIPASSWIGFFLDYVDPVTQEPSPADNMATPVASSDWLTFVNSDGTGTNQTAISSVFATFFGQTAVCTVWNGAGTTVYLTKFQLSGKSLQRQPDVSYQYDDSSSQAIYGQRNYSFQDDIMADSTFIGSYARFLKDRMKNPVPDISIMLCNRFPDQLDIEFASKLNIQESNSGVNSQFSIKAIRHEIRSPEVGTQHTTTYLVEQLRDSGVLILDHPTFGQLDNRTLGF